MTDVLVALRMHAEKLQLAFAIVAALHASIAHGTGCVGSPFVTSCCSLQRTLPVTTAGLNPLCLLNSSNIQAITRSSVPISGAGISVQGPNTSFIPCMQGRCTQHLFGVKSSCRADLAYKEQRLPDNVCIVDC
eukprot:GHRR01016817.1.p1 GENE.GHRR01016817.1~~GHRR01016817.1.p1  ORF type:complete len:133 (+),score=15.64 GHRR01016817.1:1100-1498(+)